MAVNGIGEYGGFGYKVFDIPKVDFETVKKQDEAQRIAEEALPVIEAPQVIEESPKEPDNRSRIANLEDVSITFNQGEDYGYIGSDFEIGGLDMEKAVSEMRRDKILEDYQYFVGPSQNLDTGFASDDGKVFLKF